MAFDHRHFNWVGKVDQYRLYNDYISRRIILQAIHYVFCQVTYLPRNCVLVIQRCSWRIDSCWVQENLLTARRLAISYWYRDFTYVSSGEMYQIKPHIDILYNPFLRNKVFLHFVLLWNLTVTEWKIRRLLARRQLLNIYLFVRPLSQYLICQEVLTFPCKLRRISPVVQIKLISLYKR